MPEEEKKVEANEKPIEVATTEEVVPAEVQPEAPKKKNNILLIIGIIIGAIVIILGCVVGYGYWNGSRIKKFAADSEKMYAVTDDWDKAFEEDDMDKVKDNIAEIKSESDKALADLRSKPVPRKSKQLKADLVEYFTLSKKVATDTEGIVDWVIEIEKASDSLSNIASLDTTSPESMAADVEKAKEDIDESLKKLEKISVPESFEKQHEAFVKLLEDLSEMYGKLAAALRANDLNALTTITNEFAASTSDLSEFDKPEDTLEKAYGEDKDRLDALDKSINDAISSLKKVSFSF